MRPDLSTQVAFDFARLPAINTVSDDAVAPFYDLPVEADHRAETSVRLEVPIAPGHILTCAGHDNTVRWTQGERLHHLFEDRCDQLMSSGKTDHPAVVTDETIMSYQQLDEKANQTARYLKAQGVQPGDRVGVLFDKSIETYVALLAIAKAGAAYVPFDASFPQERIAFIAGDANVGLVVTLSQFEAHFGKIDVSLILLDRDAATIDTFSTQRPNDGRIDGAADQLCYIIYTSGSTGNPKGVAIEQASICNFIRAAGEVYGITEHDRVYQGMTIAFDFSVEELWVPLIAGATLVPGKPGTNLLGKDLADFLNHHGVTALCCVPTLLATIEEDLPQLRFLLVSGEACPHDLVARWYRPDRTMLNAYGPTEATVTATVTELYPNKPVTIGKPLPTYVIVILHENKNEALAKGGLGEICTAGVGLAKEYVNRQDLTKKGFVDNFLGLPNNPSRRIYRTGDLGRITEQGEIEYLGRIDTQVKIRGYRIELTEIESALLQVPGIAQAVVSTYEPEPGVKELVAYYTRRRTACDVSTADIVAALKGKLPAYMVPAFFEEVATIPMLPSNKVDRKSLPSPKSPRYSASLSSYVAPADEMEEFLARGLADSLKIDRVSVQDNFFDELGCHSLLMAQYCAKIRRHLPNTELSMRDVYLHPTIAKLARHLSSAESSHTRTKVQTDYRKASNLEYYGCGTLQLLYYLATIGGGVWLILECYRWIAVAATFDTLLLRALGCSTGFFVLSVAVPVLLKWILIGKWKQTEIPIWGRGYFRFWVVKQLTRSSPIALAKGTPAYNIYLRLLGAKIGRHAFIHSRFTPVCTDLISIGEGAVLRKDSILLGYKGQSGYIHTGPITIGKNAVVGEASVLDICSIMGDCSQLGHASTLLSGQTVPDGQSYHGSPAQYAGVDYLAVPPKKCSDLRRFLYAAYQLALVPLGLTLMILVIYYIQNDVAQSGPSPITMATTADVLLTSLAAFFGALLLGLLLVGIMSRILNPLIKEDKVYVLYGFHYLVLRFISGASNNFLFNVLFGDSSYIVHYLRLIGYKLNKYLQTGSNFGTRQVHDIPTMCEIGRGTMISGGLSMVNAKFTSSSFKVSKVRIGADNFLGNEIHYPAGATVGTNCLLATKVMVPLHGEVKEGIGLLGSPSFEIPRASLRDKKMSEIDGMARRSKIRKKDFVNLCSMVFLLLFNWAFLFAVLMFIHAVWLLHGIHGDAVLILGALTVVVAAIGFLIFGERLSSGFKRMEPTVCSMYDPQFWAVERYWKFTESILLVIFKGTPFRNVVSRLSGVRVGKKVFDDGCVVTEKTLVTVGDYCTLNETALLQAHSLEEGVYKADDINIGNGCTIGVQSFVHYGVDIGDNACIEPDAFVMKGEVVEAGAAWRGNPARAS